MHNAPVAVRYGLILEAFLSGCTKSVLEEFVKQQEVIIKITSLARVRGTRNIFTLSGSLSKFWTHSHSCQEEGNIEKGIRDFGSSVNFHASTFRNVRSNQCYMHFDVVRVVVKGILLDQCRVMDSARSPLVS